MFTTIAPLIEQFAYQSGFGEANNDPIGKIDCIELRGENANLAQQSAIFAGTDRRVNSNMIKKYRGSLSSSIRKVGDITYADLIYHNEK